MTFKDRCYHELLKVPKGKVTTYSDLAKAVGTKAVRAVGTAMAKNKHLIHIPCHRVVRRNGDIGEYALGQSKKIALLKNEGVDISKARVTNLTKYLHKF